jgi:hypothetical protein
VEVEDTQVGFSQHEVETSEVVLKLRGQPRRNLVLRLLLLKSDGKKLHGFLVIALKKNKE